MRTAPGALDVSRKTFHTTPQVWLNLQQRYDLWHAARDSKARQGARVLFRGTVPAAPTRS